ncbi:hypothetical protein J2Y86_001999 [Pseudomonas migulae]|nr:hypothetical protein [Pseudomonas migulae]MCP1497292.1 hypothetical protein [Pseudomonas migulae]
MTLSAGKVINRQIDSQKAEKIGFMDPTELTALSAVAYARLLDAT